MNCQQRNPRGIPLRWVCLFVLGLFLFVCCVFLLFFLLFLLFFGVFFLGGSVFLITYVIMLIVNSKCLKFVFVFNINI